MLDYIVRATAANNQIRAFAGVTREQVEFARSAHNTSPVATAALGRLLTAGSLMGCMMKGDDDLLTIKINCDGPIQGLVVTSDSSSNVKGYAYNPHVIIPANNYGKLDVSGALGNGVMTVMKDIGMKEPYSGQINLISGEIAEDLTYYFATSEQIPSSVALGVLMDYNNTVKQAGGFIIQLMPNTDDEIIDKLEQKLEHMKSFTTMLEEGNTPEMILENILGEFNPCILETIQTEFKCNCSKERTQKAIISMGAEEITDIINEGKPIDVHCHFCNKDYTFTVEELKTYILGMLEN